MPAPRSHSKPTARRSAPADPQRRTWRLASEAALTAAEPTHEFLTVPGVDHAFVNDTGARNTEAAAQVYGQVLDRFGARLT